MGSCKNAVNKSWYERNKERITARKAEYRANNRAKIRAQAAAYRVNNRERIREMRFSEKLRSRYGMTVNDYNALLARSGGLCEICRRPSRRLCVDHDHDTGRVRGMLCDKCNTSLGNFSDDILTLESAISYLKTNGQKDI